jgi:hypothetical protein
LRRQPFLPFFVVSGSWISGRLALSALEDALNAVVARHGALRAAIGPSARTIPADRAAALEAYVRTGACRSEIYTQSLRDDVRVVLRERMLGAAPADRDAEIAALVDEECAASFELDRPPSMRAMLLTRRGSESLLVTVWPHLISDGWSTQVFRSELQREYARLVAGLPATPAVPFSYEQFAAAQHEQAKAGHFRHALDFWREQWQRLEAEQWGRSELPFSSPVRQRSGQGDVTMNTAQEALSLGPAMSAALKTRARESGVTLFMYCLAACGVCLHRLTGRARIPIWTNFANRTPLTSHTLGWLANTHLVGVEIDADATCDELVQRTRRIVLEAAAAQELPLTLLWRTLGKSLISGIGIAFDFDAPLPPQRWQGAPPPIALKKAILPGSRQTTVHLHLTGRIVGDEITFKAWHSTDLCTPDDGRRLLNVLRETIAAMINEPASSRVSALRVGGRSR